MGSAATVGATGRVQETGAVETIEYGIAEVARLAGTTSRAAATEFAFVVGIPTMFAATAYELAAMLAGGGIGHEDWSALGVAFVASAITAFVAVKWLLHYIQSHRFTAFAVYRVVLGVALLLLVPAGT